MERGDLVSDDIVVKIVAERLQKDDVKSGYVLDGFPRNVAQARELEAPCAEPGVYRAEVWVEIGSRKLPWILSSPIYVRAAPSEGEAQKPGEVLAGGDAAQR
jgi:adenylate kinase family enzyme